MLVYIILYFMVIDIPNAAGGDAVNLTSSVSRFGHVTVCRNETVLYECSVSGSNLIWRLSGIPSANHLYIKSDYINKVRFVGPSVMWLSNNQSLTSQLVLAYDPKLNNSTIKCFLNRTTFKSTTYITQVEPDVPLFSKPILIGQSDDTVQYQLEWAYCNDLLSDLDHYKLQIISLESTEMFVSSLENTTVISTDVGVNTNVTIVAVSRCGTMSLSDEVNLPAVNQLNPKDCSTDLKTKVLYIVLSSLILGLIIILIVTVIIIVLLTLKVKSKIKLSKKIHSDHVNASGTKENVPLLRSKMADQGKL